ncbi:MAG TPA: threonylcarbamoyl-AMP synthase [Acidobacteria bacterium]|nr:threonylcarbamoyl-AMP synthase [Acidobacteriota bacterium]
MRVEPFREGADVRRVVPVVREVVASGGVVLLPTETYYGLGAAPGSSEGVERVFRLKERPAGRPLLVLCADWAQLEELVEVPSRWRIRLSRTWPGPLTVILPARKPLAAAPSGRLAVRIPGASLLRALLYRVGPLTGTSANRSGSPPHRRPRAAAADLAAPPDLVLDGGETPGGAPSTLVDLCGNEPRVLRIGPASWS